MKKAVVYLNQFFGQIGGEDVADHAPEIREEKVGAAMLYNQLLDAEVTHTVICGDNFMGSRTEEAVETILDFLKDVDFDIFFAGPAFQAGRYGMACGEIGKAVKEEFDVPVISSMNIENPGVEVFKKDIYIFPGGHSAAKMRDDVKKITDFGNKILNGEKLLPAEKEGYYKRGIRHQYFLEDETPAYERAIDMLLKKINGEEFESELPIPELDLVEIAPAIEDLSKTTIALVTSGGIVPVDNPDKIQSASATRWGKYDISAMDKLDNREDLAFKTIHAGYDPAAADADPNVVVPVDAMRKYEKEGRIGKLHDYFYSTVGTGTTQKEAARMGKEIAQELQDANVQAVILTST
ncbi:glycine reductase [Halanaerobium saccharolyticum]|uniref:Glycine reductase n=2 Tax=Halanaerobium saccharolyticum TaxID=43595 RepID=A0A4R7Z9D7_9FIRM|nr:glycine reductase [Halanaerobium saccharolyticum]TDW07601.1 glycine reductase [Halanaerobium saccharolyticum]TDX64522.1 glycine reductase [Halanaerobium saccharolyticum]